MSGKPKRKAQDPKRWVDHEAREREHQAVDQEGEALAECYRIPLEAGAIKPIAEEKR